MIYVDKASDYATYTDWKLVHPPSQPLPEEPHWFVRTLPKANEVVILPISDLHYGNPLFSKSHFFRTLEYIEKHANAFAVLNGDLCECVTRQSLGSLYEQVGTPQDQRDWLIQQLESIKKKILGVTMGNHEYRIWSEVGMDICKDVADHFGAPYRRDGLMLRLDLNGLHYWLYMTHGYGGARTKSGKMVKLERTATWVSADVYIMSHDHVVNAEPDIYLVPEAGTEREDNGFTVGTLSAQRKMLVKSNAYLKWGGYSEFKGYPPVDLETPLIKLSGTGHKVKVEI